MVIATDDILAPEQDEAALSQPSLAKPSIASVVKVSTVRSGLDPSGNRTVSSDQRSLSRSGPLSGLLH
jgi:hypothetical protein